MVARVWHGWTREADADAYAVEFEILTLFDSLDSVRGFAGDDYEVPVIEPEARRLLTHGDERAVHYEVAVAPF